MTQQSCCWAYTQRKPEMKETHVPPTSMQHCSLQYSCLENSMDQGAWHVMVCGDTEESDVTLVTKQQYLLYYTILYDTTRYDRIRYYMVLYYTILIHCLLSSTCACMCVQCFFMSDCSLPASSVHGIPQVRILEWVAMSSYRRSS